MIEIRDLKFRTKDRGEHVQHASLGTPPQVSLMMGPACERLPQDHIVGSVAPGVHLNGFTTIEGACLDESFFQSRKQTCTSAIIAGKYNVNGLGQEISPLVNQAL